MFIYNHTVHAAPDGCNLELDYYWIIVRLFSNAYFTYIYIYIYIYMFYYLSLTKSYRRWIAEVVYYNTFSSD